MTKQNLSAAPRSMGIDIVKIAAAVMVTCVHFFNNTAFYTSIPVTGPEFIAPISVLWIFYTCVPLFMITTGYLMKNKTLSAKYYTGIIRVAVFYLVCSTACMLYRMSGGAVFTVWTALREYLQFTMCGYAWYVKQYLVMFLMIPFLNLAYSGLQSKRQKLLLVGTAFFLFSVAPSFFLGFDPKNQIQPFPMYIRSAFPVAYYYIGCYIREYPPKRTLQNKLAFFGIAALTDAVLSLILYRSSVKNIENGQYFCAPHLFQYESYPVVILSTCLFLLLFDIPAPRAGKFLPERAVRILCGAVGFLAQTSLLTYLFSFIFDRMFYPEFTEKYPYPEFLLRFRHFFEIQPKVYACSLLCALPVLLIYSLIAWGIRRLSARRQAKRASVQEETQ